MNLNELLDTEELHMKRMQDLVNEAIAEENLLSQKILEAENEEIPTLGQRLADKLADFGGSWWFIIVFSFIIMCWIFINAYHLVNPPYDPYPFILLNLVLSCLAALQAPVIMMSQNRQEEKDRRRARNDYMINLKAEIEVRNLHGKLDLIITEQMRTLFEIQKKQIEMLQELSEKTKAR